MILGQLLSLVLGFSLLAAFGITTDQIMQNVYDSTNTALRTNLVAGGSGAATPTPLVFGTPGVIPVFAATELGSYAGATCPTPQVATGISASGALTCAAAASTTATPLVFGTPGEIAIFAATELGRYPGAACTPPALALSTSASGAWTCATPVPAATATPLGNLSYSGALNVTGINSISSSATPVATDRYIRCTSGSSADQTYTLPSATGTGRVISVKKIDSGTKACIVSRAGGDTIDGATSVTLGSQYQSVTVLDGASTLWEIQ